MIYVSSSCVKADTIQKSVLTLVHEGFRNIELSGGTKYYDNFANDLLVVKEKFDLRPTQIEGDSDSGWMLLDYGGVILHLFSPDLRDYYALEQLWADGRVVLRMA